MAADLIGQPIESRIEVQAVDIVDVACPAARRRGALFARSAVKLLDPPCQRGVVLPSFGQILVVDRQGKPDIQRHFARLYRRTAPAPAPAPAEGSLPLPDLISTQAFSATL